MVGWVNLHREKHAQPIISVDGKVLKGAKASKQEHPLYMVSAFDVDEGLTLTHQPCDGKGMELIAIKNMLDALDVRGCLLTADAQFQDYWALPEEQQESYITEDKGHGREEIREVYVLPASFSEELKDKWSVVKSIVAVVRDIS
ncbi:ISAs1 family transposase, partial [Vibrio parahaemolyticus]|uniref:ISAs1 family transposase n=1 Tax=Vibrio parahaemolyticus TaxID=670 RepID=UPI0011208204